MARLASPAENYFFDSRYHRGESRAFAIHREGNGLCSEGLHAALEASGKRPAQTRRAAPSTTRGPPAATLAGRRPAPAALNKTGHDGRTKPTRDPWQGVGWVRLAGRVANWYGPSFGMDGAIGLVACFGKAWIELACACRVVTATNMRWGCLFACNRRLVTVA